MYVVDITTQIQNLIRLAILLNPNLILGNSVSSNLDYETRLKIPIRGNPETEFFTPTGLRVAKGYTRIVIGNRGPYIEFMWVNLVSESFKQVELWRLHNPNAFYLEYRSKDYSKVKLYYQLKTVDYADYQPGLFYLSPFELRLSNRKSIIESITGVKRKTLFD